MLKAHKSLITLFILAFSIHGSMYSQLNDTVFYEIIKSNPKANFITGHVHLMSVDIEKYNFSFKTGIGAKMSLKKVYFDLGWEYNYADGIAEFTYHDETSDYGGVPIYQDQNSRNGFITAGFAIIDKKQTKKVRVNVKKRRNTLYYVKVPAEVNLKLNIEMGFRSGFSWYSLNNLDVTGLLHLNNKVNTFNGGDLYTYMDYSWITIGASISSFVDVRIKLETLGKKNTKAFFRFYAAILISTKMDFEDI